MIIVVPMLSWLLHCPGLASLDIRTEETGAPKVSQAKKAKLERGLKLLRSCPTWVDAGPNEDPKVKNETADAILAAVSSLAALPNETLKDIVTSFDKETHGSPLALSRVYILNRVVFDVPEWRRRDDHFMFGVYSGIPYDSDHIAELWPLHFDSNGKPSLIDRLGITFAYGYLASAEFEYFVKHYPRRHLPQITTMRCSATQSHPQ
jgi:hypothetical protein